MLPVAAIDDVRYGCGADPVHSRYFHMRHYSGNRPDRSHVVLSQPRRWVALASHLLGGLSQVMFVARVVPPFANHVLRVLLRCAGKQVIGVYALRVVARVAAKVAIRHDLTGAKEGVPVSQHDSPGVIPKKPVPFWVSRPSPLPAARRMILRDVTVESLWLGSLPLLTRESGRTQSSAESPKAASTVKGELALAPLAHAGLDSHGRTPERCRTIRSMDGESKQTCGHLAAEGDR